ncbi:hypothetical protein NUSPORA_02125 [Nucleospora cyclopteri]
MLLHTATILCSNTSRHDASPRWAVNCQGNPSTPYNQNIPNPNPYCQPSPCFPVYQSECYQSQEPIQRSYGQRLNYGFFPLNFDFGKSTNNSQNFGNLNNRLHELIDQTRTTFSEGFRLELDALHEHVDTAIVDETNKFESELKALERKLADNIESALKAEKNLDQDASTAAFTALNSSINAEIVALRALDDAAIVAAVNDDAAGLLPSLTGFTTTAQTAIETGLTANSLKTRELVEKYLTEFEITSDALISTFSTDLIGKIRSLFDEALTVFNRFNDDSIDEVKRRLDQILSEELKGPKRGKSGCGNPLLPLFN